MASDKSWFWIYKKQATGVLILVDTVNFKADIISYESYYHSGSMKTTFIIEINSHSCNEYFIKNYKHQSLWNADCHVRNVPNVTHFGQQIKNNLT